MSSPAHQPGPESGGGPRFELCLHALKGWRNGLVREGRLPPGGLKDAHLRNALIRGRRDARLIASMVPASYAHVADDLLNVIMDADATSPLPAQTRQPPSPVAPSPVAPSPVAPSPVAPLPVSW